MRQHPVARDFDVQRRFEFDPARLHRVRPIRPPRARPVALRTPAPQRSGRLNTPDRRDPTPWTPAPIPQARSSRAGSTAWDDPPSMSVPPSAPPPPQIFGWSRMVAGAPSSAQGAATLRRRPVRRRACPMRLATPHTVSRRHGSTELGSGTDPETRGPEGAAEADQTPATVARRPEPHAAASGATRPPSHPSPGRYPAYRLKHLLGSSHRHHDRHLACQDHAAVRPGGQGATCLLGANRDLHGRGIH